jgi:undecaprenyl-diphosphatase
MILFFRFNKKYSIVVFLLAVLVGISRIYLLAHFKEDVLFGSFLGLISAMVAYFYYNKSIRLESSTDE